MINGPFYTRDILKYISSAEMLCFFVIICNH